MYKRNTIMQNQRYCSYEDFCRMFGIGLTLARKFANEHDLTIHIGRRVLIDIDKAEQALRSQNSEEC